MQQNVDVHGRRLEADYTPMSGKREGGEGSGKRSERAGDKEKIASQTTSYYM